jgi:TolB-like protein/DNA-binding winged helix-turn-helix (wHTH) protein
MDTPAPASFAINEVVADLSSETLRGKDGNAIPLRAQTFSVLRHLLRHSGRVVSKDELMRAVWPNTAVTDDSLVQCIHEIRRAIGDDKHAILKTVSRRGYRLDLPPGVVARPDRKYPPRTAIAVTLAIAVAAAGVAGWWMSAQSQAGRTEKPLVAVLPFKNLAGDEASQRLAGGVTEDIITDLARFPEFRVVANNSSKALGEAIDASFVVEGSIQRQADRIRVTAQLVDRASGKNLWSERWDRPDDDLFAIQTSIAEQVSNRLGGGAGIVQAAGRDEARRKRPENLTAYEFYLLGTEKLERITKTDIEEAIRLLNRAVELDPSLARAWAELYHSHCLAASFGADRDAMMEKAHAAAQKAVTLDPGDAEAHAVYAMSLATKGEYRRARSEFDVALRMAPGAAEILIFYIGWASTLGEPEKGPDLISEAIRLDPNYPMWASGIFAYAYFMAGRYEESLSMLDRQSVENYNRGRWVFKIGSLAALGRVEEAQRWLGKALEAHPDLTIEALMNDPGYNAAEHQRLAETMRLAGLRVCATDEELAALKMSVRLPECGSAESSAAPQN